VNDSKTVLVLSLVWPGKKAGPQEMKPFPAGNITDSLVFDRTSQILTLRRADTEYWPPVVMVRGDERVVLVGANLQIDSVIDLRSNHQNPQW
jgi:hypothetical protein